MGGGGGVPGFKQSVDSEVCVEGRGVLSPKKRRGGGGGYLISRNSWIPPGSQRQNRERPQTISLQLLTCRGGNNFV